MGQLLAAGLSATNTLKQLERHPPGHSYRKPLAISLAAIEQGSTFTEGARSAGAWLPPFDLALLEAGEASGRLESCMAALADYYEQRAQIARNLIAALLYPAFLLHAAVIILAIPQAFASGNWLGLLTRAGAILGPIYIAVILGIFVAQSRHGESWRVLMERLLGLVPVLGQARRELALARLAMALEGLLAAGVTIIEAWRFAATSSGSPALRREVESWVPRLNDGLTPAELVRDSRKFPEVFSSQYATGEISGKLEDTLRRMHKYYQDAGSRKLFLLAQWIPWLVYGAVIVYIVNKVFQFWSGYFQQIQDVL
jgi:type II secretory pathway component PulF